MKVKFNQAELPLQPDAMCATELHSTIPAGKDKVFAGPSAGDLKGSASFYETPAWKHERES